MNKEIETVIKKLKTKQNKTKQKNLGIYGFPGEFYHIFKEELIPILLKFFQKIEEKGILPNLSYKASIILIPKPEKDTTRKENYRPIIQMNTYAKVFKKYYQTLFNRSLNGHTP